MVDLKITQLTLPSGVTHVSTDWEVSTSIVFDTDNLVNSSYLDTINLNNIMFDNDLDPGVQYYGRARALLTTGYTVWGNIDVIMPTYIQDNDIRVESPSYINVPSLTTDSIQTSHDTMLFKLIATNYNAYGTAAHDSTSWFLEDMKGNVIWQSIYNNIYKDSIPVVGIMLKSNNIYRARAIFHGSSGDSSQISTYTFITNNYLTVKINSDLNTLFTAGNINLSFTYVPGVNTIDVSIYAIENNLPILVFNNKGIFNKDLNNNLIVTIPDKTLYTNGTFVVKFSTNLDRNLASDQFNTFNN